MTDKLDGSRPVAGVITAERLREVLRYCPETGEFRWLVSRGRVSAGTTAGCRDAGYGYTIIKIDGRIYMAHRLAWLYMTGGWPNGEIDHANRVPSDNRWGNLRDATRSQNQANSEPCRKNTSGFKGVTLDKRTKRWDAVICVNKRFIYLGRFQHKHEAALAYRDAALKHFGEFACVPGEQSLRRALALSQTGGKD